MTSRAAWFLPVAFVGLALSPGIGRDQPSERDQLLTRLGADRWHAAGARGQGIKVLIIDSGFRGWQSQLGIALPGSILTRSFRGDAVLDARDSSHGILCGEVIHALAPDAELIFATWEPDDAASFIKAVEWGKQKGARVMSCSVIMPCWSDGEGGGPIHAALIRAMGTGDKPGDLLGIACAGNTAQRHWRGAFHAGKDGSHEWAAGQTLNTVTPWNDERVSVEMCHPPGAGFSLQVINTVTGAEIGRATADAGGSCAVVRFLPAPGARYAAKVWPRPEKGSGPFLAAKKGPDPFSGFHVSVLSGWLERCTERGSIPFPADGPEFVAVGAVDEARHRVAYSSCGPNGPSPKPDFVAQVPVWTAARTGSFSGTSAAAPQAAGLAALVLSRHPDWSPTMVRSALQKAAVDIAPPGHDAETGYGFLRLPAAE